MSIHLSTFANATPPHVEWVTPYGSFIRTNAAFDPVTNQLSEIVYCDTSKSPQRGWNDDRLPLHPFKFLLERLARGEFKLSFNESQWRSAYVRDFPDDLIKRVLAHYEQAVPVNIAQYLGALKQLRRTLKELQIRGMNDCGTVEDHEKAKASRKGALALVYHHILPVMPPQSEAAIAVRKWISERFSPLCSPSIEDFLRYKHWTSYYNLTLLKAELQNAITNSTPTIWVRKIAFDTPLLQLKVVRENQLVVEHLTDGAVTSHYTVVIKPDMFFHHPELIECLVAYDTDEWVSHNQTAKQSTILFSNTDVRITRICWGALEKDEADCMAAIDAQG